MNKYKKIYMEIWHERPHVCAVCGEPISTPVLHNFSHIYTKGSQPALKMVKANIQVWCSSVNREEGRGCHELWSTQPHKFWERANKHGWVKPTVEEIVEAA